MIRFRLWWVAFGLWVGSAWAGDRQVWPHLERAFLEPLQGRKLISVTGRGFLYEQGGAVLFRHHGAQEDRAVPALPAVPVASFLSDLHKLAFCSDERLFIFEAGAWQAFSLPVWYEYQPQQPVLRSVFGLNLVWPAVMSLSESEVWLYQRKTGKLRILDLRTGSERVEPLEKDLVPIWTEGGVLWIGAPKKGVLGLTLGGGRFEVVDRLELKNLNKYSLVFSTRRGCWLLTFPKGLGDGLQSWRSGTVDTRLFYLRVEGRAIKKSEFSFPNMPVSISLSTSASGSPKIKAEPDFLFQTVADSEELVLFSGREAVRVDRRRGEVERKQVAYGWRSIVGLSQRGRTLVVSLGNGQYHEIIWSETR